MRKILPSLDPSKTLDLMALCSSFAPLPSHNYSFNLAELNELIRKNDISRILADKKLFWLAYCKSVASSSDPHPEISIKGETVTLELKQHVFKGLQLLVEKFRVELLEDFNSKKDINFLIREWGSSLYMKKEKKPGEVPNEKICSLFIYKEYFKLYLPNLMQLIGATCKQEEIVVDHTENNFPIKVDITAFRIYWDREQYFVYTIPPKALAPREKLDTTLYKLYQEQKLCDFDIQLQSGGTKKVHKLMLFMHGGEMIQSMLNPPMPMKEVYANQLDLSQFSDETVEIFIAFVYGGPELATKRLLKEPNKNNSNNNNNSNTFTTENKQLDLYEIFAFANMYNIKPMVDWCANQLSLYATPSDYEAIVRLEKKYNNDYLKELADHLLIGKVVPGVTKLILNEVERLTILKA